MCSFLFVFGVIFLLMFEVGVGFSMGGNLLLKYMGEWKEDSLLTSTVVLSTGFDIVKGNFLFQLLITPLKIYSYLFF